MQQSSGGSRQGVYGVPTEGLGKYRTTLITHYLAWLICVLGGTTASDENLPSTEDHQPLWGFAIKGGTCIVLNGQSHALLRRISYTMRAELTYQVIDGRKLGAGAIVPATLKKTIE